MVLDQAEREARMVMSRLVEPGDLDACRLVHEHSASAVLQRLRERHGNTAKLADWAVRMSSTSLDEIRSAADAVQARFICPGDSEWPQPLADIGRIDEVTTDRRGGSPFGLWVRGPCDLAADTRRAVALVGARAATAYGEHVAGDLAGECALAGFTVVSGGAYGIDAASHRGALASERPTVAILAGGVDRFYPSGNTVLLERIAASGLVLAEAAPGCAPSKSRFLVRNRLIAALSQGVVIVEAALRSGALNTARWARDLNRCVMGVPGPVTSQASAGVHQLLRQPETVLVTDAAEVVEQLSPIGTGLAAVKSGATAIQDRLDARSRRVLDAVPVYNPAQVASIAAVAGMAHHDVARRLDALRELGLVVGDDRGWALNHD